jgi:hypothetical protein
VSASARGLPTGPDQRQRADAAGGGSHLRQSSRCNRGSACAAPAGCNRPAPARCNPSAPECRHPWASLPAPGQACGMFHYALTRSADLLSLPRPPDPSPTTTNARPGLPRWRRRDHTPAKGTTWGCGLDVGSEEPQAGAGETVPRRNGLGTVSERAVGS